MAVSGITYINEFVKINQLVQNRKVAQAKQPKKERERDTNKQHGALITLQFYLKKERRLENGHLETQYEYLCHHTTTQCALYS